MKDFKWKANIKAAQTLYLNSFSGNVAREGVEPSTSGL